MVTSCFTLVAFSGSSEAHAYSLSPRVAVRISREGEMPANIRPFCGSAMAGRCLGIQLFAPFSLLPLKPPSLPQPLPSFPQRPLLPAAHPPLPSSRAGARH